jgi:tousled-like kinase
LQPFGDGQTQASILENKTILNATDVIFPSKPNVTKEAQAFIRRCLQYKKEERADVLDLYNHEYLRPTRGVNKVDKQGSKHELTGLPGPLFTTPYKMLEST